MNDHAPPLQLVYPRHALRSDWSMLYPVDDLGSKGDPETHLRLLTAILNAIATAPPLPPRRRADIIQLPGTGPHGHPGTNLSQLHAQAPITPPSLTIPRSSKSLNVAWLEKICGNGFPFSLTRLISYDQRGTTWRKHLEGPALCQATALLGFLPIATIKSRSFSPGPSHVRMTRSRRAEEQRRQRYWKNASHSGGDMLDMSEEMQRQGERECARPLAFRMRFLSPRRGWGPYLYVHNNGEVESCPPPLPASEDYRLDEQEEDEDSEGDSDYVPPEDPADSDSTPPPPPPGPPAEKGALPSPDQLHPDWTWLAAGRMVAQWHLRTHVDEEAVARLEDWNNLRAGVWAPREEEPGEGEDADGQAAQEGSADAPDEEEWRKHQRDWAGAEGVWRYVQ